MASNSTETNAVLSTSTSVRKDDEPLQIIELVLHSKAKNVVNECHTKYENVMKLGIGSVRTDDELQDLHKRAAMEAGNIFQRKCAQLMEKYEEELKGGIEDTWEELKDLFELKRKRAEENIQLKGMLVDCLKFYHDDMRKHSNRNSPFLRTDHLIKCHEQARTVVINKCMEKAPITAYQTSCLEAEMDSLYLKYKRVNDMKLNSADGTSPAIGIDLGTNYCCVAVFYNGQVIYIPNKEQENSETTPSYVAYNSDGSTTFGKIAKEEAYRNPECTLYDVKRIIGRKFNDPELQRNIELWPFHVEEEEGFPKININRKRLFPEEVSAQLLGKFKMMAEQHLGREPGSITKAVITVPAYFTDNQRQATKDAGELAGLEVLSILNEPTAAAIAYSWDRLDNTARKVLVFDLGSGSFDVAVLDVTPKGINLLGVDGDIHFGGTCFDKMLTEYCVEMFKQEEGIDLMDGMDSTVKLERNDARRRLRRLQTECEKAKKNLSSSNMTIVSVEVMYDLVNLQVKITRDKFDELNKSLFQKIIDIVDRLLNNSPVRKDEIEEIVLVGGSTRIPKIQNMLMDYFGGKALNRFIDPEKVVAFGAAVLAAAEWGATPRKNKECGDGNGN